ncbi:putative toxin-antitoxin system toxin component, PIN family [Sphingomonas rubra]|uniref:Putative toxin-antitoxin system toxin component, PIN family n=1 Tax=Sphingomonas rubra TaxID=634430 RepID=A0A1I5QVP8_9SPHN|nr:putative toxin-antitoxin system toxin component, PIN family [Sphingomonas rubra]SFP50101.1 putative toxin-antitoxin system toxin component, PIN family [Sphingomonas rubra]
MKIVLDTDVFVAALRSSTGASIELLRLARVRKVAIIVSVPLVIEYEAVATRDTQLTASGLSVHNVNAILDVLVDMAVRTAIDYSYRPATRDPNDDFVLEAAVNGRADAIVTFNRRDFGDAPSRFGIACLLPREALERARRE